MSIKPIGSQRVQISESPVELVITLIAGCRARQVLIFEVVWLLGWTVIGGIINLKKLFAGGGAGWSLLDYYSLCAWAIGFIVIGSVLAWHLFGFERITLSAQTLSHEIKVGIYSSQHQYERSKISNLHIVPGANPWPKTAWAGVPVISRGCLAFEYDNKTLAFGLGLEDSEAAHVKDVLRRRLDLAA